MVEATSFYEFRSDWNQSLFIQSNHTLYIDIHLECHCVFILATIFFCNLMKIYASSFTISVECFYYLGASTRISFNNLPIVESVRIHTLQRNARIFSHSHGLHFSYTSKNMLCCEYDRAKQRFRTTIS